MAIRVALHHRTTYEYSKTINLGPQTVRLRPAPHCRTPVLSYSLKVEPKDHFCNWQQDPQGNYLARLVFNKPTNKFEVTVDLVTDMSSINPFDFFLEEYADFSPFVYEEWLQGELLPFMRLDPKMTGPKFDAWIATVPKGKIGTIPFLIDLNQRLQSDIKYTVRLEPGVQTPEETLEKMLGSCRDTGWLLVNILRRLGFAARFASGYLVQLAADQKSLDGPSGPTADFTDLHAWTEVYLPGAGWIGMDPTSGLFCGEGHLPLACSPEPLTAAPISGAIDPCESEFSFEMKVTRIHEDPRTTKPYSDQQWESIDSLGESVDKQLMADDVRLTFGGEPTFVSIDDMEGAEWNSAAVGPHKRKLSAELLKRLRTRFAPGGLLHYGQGKWYPGEQLPRWAMACYWRADGQPLWQDETLIADESRSYGFEYKACKRFAMKLAENLGVEPCWLMPAYEDVLYYMWKEQRLPINVSPLDSKVEDPEERARLAKVFTNGISKPVGLVMPLRRQWEQSQATPAAGKQPGYKWSSGPWPVRPEKLFLIPGDSPVGLRLPLDTLPHSGPADPLNWVPDDPFMGRQSLPMPPTLVRQNQNFGGKGGASEKANESPEELKLAETKKTEKKLDDDSKEYGSYNVVKDPDEIDLPEYPKDISDKPIHRTAMCIEARQGKLYIFMPPTESLEDYVELLWALEKTAGELRMPIVLEGYLPPTDYRLKVLKVTPDPGVIEVNVQPASSWWELKQVVEGVYDDARHTRLGTEKFDLDGKHTGTGGGNHIVMGGPTPADSPFLRRPDLLRSMVSYWINHPSLSYLFSGRFVGPTSQSPRPDEGRKDATYELQLAMDIMPKRGDNAPVWLVDRILRNLLTDLTGNTHRAEICIDKLCSPDSSTGRLGLVELRAFEMPPHPQMSLSTQLLIRSLIAMFWRQPYTASLARWDTHLHDQFLLPHFLEEDLTEIISDLQHAGMPWDSAWFKPHVEFRLPPIGFVQYDGVGIELRQAIEPWYVLGEEPGGGGTVRCVDSSIERIQVKTTSYDPKRHQVLINGVVCPLQATRVPGQYVCGVRFRAWQPPSCLHPTIPVHTPLVLDLVDMRAGRAVGGCSYHVSHPGGRSYDVFPVNALEAEARRASRFWPHGHTPGPLVGRIAKPNPDFPLTLDLRRE